VDLYASSDETIHAYATWHYTPGVVVAGADPERLRGGVGAGTAGGCHRRQLHILEAAQRRDVGILGPAAIRVAPMTPTRRGLVIPSPALVMGSLR